MPATVSLPRSVAERARREASRLGVSLEEYLIDLIAQGLDPKERALEYAEAAADFLEQARVELERGNLRQAAEKVWDATALAIKAYACWREGRRLASHGELWEYKDRVAEDLGDWVEDSWNAGNSMHTCFYEGWCTRRSVEAALRRVERLVREVAARVRPSRA